MMRLGALALLGSAHATVTKRSFAGENMNGEYLLAPTPKGSATQWSTNFKDYPGGVESFEFYTGSISSTYGEVFWTGLPEVPLPEDIVQRFEGKGMAVVGFEVDQVRRTPEGDVSLPINLAYNHHYGATLLGAGSKMERVPYDPHDGGRTKLLTPEPGWDTIPVEHTPSASGLPTSLWCGYSNGGEFRKSYHAIPPPFAQLIESPRSFSMSPMQIDTWNRDEMSLTGGPFVPGPAPKKREVGVWPSGSDGASKWPGGSLAPLNGTDAVYSGLLECPLTTRIKKTITGGGWNDSFTASIKGGVGPSCPKALDTADACFAAAKEVGLSASMHVTTTQGNSATRPTGCSVQVDGDSASVFFNHNASSTNVCGSGVDTIEGTQASLVALGLSLSTSEGATITMTGPSASWFGVGFGTHAMPGAYAVVVDGSGTVSEHLLGDHTAGTVLNSSVKVVSNKVLDGKRTVVLSRPLTGLTAQHHSFEADKLSLDFIAALGSTPTFSYHRSRTVGTITMWPKTPSPTAGGVYGYFQANRVEGTQMRNDWNGEVGYSITPKLALTVSELGRAVSHGQRSLRAAAAVNIWSVKTHKKLATATVGPQSGAAEADGFAYEQLSAPLVLQAGEEYYITQTCSKGMPDKFTNGDTNAVTANQLVASLGSGVYSMDGHPDTFPGQKEQGPQFAGVATFKALVPPNLHPDPASACVCSVPAAEFGKGTGTVTYVDPLGKATSTIGFPPRCEPYPRETVLRDKNPTCDIRTYAGGLSTCHHGWHLLDADQEVPWPDQPLNYTFKWRFYFQEYSPAQHVSAAGWNTGIGGDTAEYDVPQCPAGTPTEQCTHTISGVVTPPAGNMHFVGAHYHCHAPTCIQMSIYNNLTGELLCREEPYHGQGRDVTHPAGASKRNPAEVDRFDEAGYIAQRVCLWGNASYGLEPPPKIGGIPLLITATTNSTYGHHGEMALPQMLVAEL